MCSLVTGSRLLRCSLEAREMQDLLQKMDKAVVCLHTLVAALKPDPAAENFNALT